MLTLLDFVRISTETGVDILAFDTLDDTGLAPDELLNEVVRSIVPPWETKRENKKSDVKFSIETALETASISGYNLNLPIWCYGTLALMKQKTWWGWLSVLLCTIVNCHVMKKSHAKKPADFNPFMKSGNSRGDFCKMLERRKKYGCKPVDET